MQPCPNTPNHTQQRKTTQNHVEPCQTMQNLVKPLITKKKRRKKMKVVSRVASISDKRLRLLIIIINCHNQIEVFHHLISWTLLLISSNIQIDWIFHQCFFASGFIFSKLSSNFFTLDIQFLTGKLIYLPKSCLLFIIII